LDYLQIYDLCYKNISDISDIQNGIGWKIRSTQAVQVDAARKSEILVIQLQVKINA